MPPGTWLLEAVAAALRVSARAIEPQGGDEVRGGRRRRGSLGAAAAEQGEHGTESVGRASEGTRCEKDKRGRLGGQRESYESVSPLMHALLEELRLTRKSRATYIDAGVKAEAETGDLRLHVEGLLQH